MKRLVINYEHSKNFYDESFEKVTKNRIFITQLKTERKTKI